MIKKSCFVLFLVLLSHGPGQTQVLLDSLNQSTLGVMIGGEFDSAGGWTPVDWSDMVIFDLDQYIVNGRFEIDIRNFDPSTQSSEARHHILAMYSDSLGNHNSAFYEGNPNTEHTVWNLHTGINYAGGGLKFLATAGSKIETTSLNRTWHTDSTYHILVSWADNRVNLYVDSVLVVSSTNTRNHAPRYLLLGRDFTRSLDINTGLPDNEYSAQIGPIYANLAVYADSTAPSLAYGDLGTVQIDLPELADIFSFDVTVTYDSTLWEFHSVATDSSGVPLNIIYNATPGELLLGAFSPFPITQFENAATARFTPKFDSTQVRVGHLDVTRFIVNEADQPLFSCTYVQRPEELQGTPVELASFGLHLVGENEIKLTWQTVSESSNLGFEVYRAYENEGFGKIAFIPGNGTSNILNSYEFTDTKLKLGQYYYRLKQVDYDGSFVYSNVTGIALQGPGGFRLFESYPNPFHDQTHISFAVPPLSDPEALRVSVFDLRGRLVRRWLPERSHANRFGVTWQARNDLEASLSSGVYFVVVEAGTQRATQKILFVR